MHVSSLKDMIKFASKQSECLVSTLRNRRMYILFDYDISVIKAQLAHTSLSPSKVRSNTKFPRLLTRRKNSIQLETLTKSTKAVPSA